MKNLLFIFVIIFFCGGCNYKLKGNGKTLPIVGTLNYVTCTWFESAELNKKAGIKKKGPLYLYFTLSNPNDCPVYLPIYSWFRDSMYLSDIEIYLKGKKLEADNINDRPSSVLEAKGNRFLEIKIWDINETNIYDSIEDLRNIISELEFRYVKYESDSIYHKMKVGDIKFVITNNLEIKYRNPESINERCIIYR